MSRPWLGLLLALIIPIVPARTWSAVAVPNEFIDETVVESFNEPIAMSFIPDGRLLVVEQRTGRVRMVVNGHRASTDPIYTVTSLEAAGGERGLQGIAVDPGWPARPYVYLVYTRTGSRIRLMRVTASGAISDPAGENLTLGSPLLLLDDIPDASGNHNGGALRFGPEGHLYLSLGEDSDQCAAQDSTSLKGQLLRLDVSRLPAGGGGPVPLALLIPPSPALASADSNARLVHAYGMRNPWRFHIDPATGLVYLGDVGDGTYEEVNEIAPGDNLGWPFREGTLTRTLGSCSEPSGSGAYLAPIRTIHHNTGAKAILTAGVYRPHPGGGSNWPTAYYGDLFHSDYTQGHLRRLERSGGVWSPAPAVPGQPNSQDWATGLVSPVDFLVGPDGSLWWLSQFNASRSPSSGSLHRIRYAGATVGVPTSPAASARFRGAPNPFVASTEIAFTLPSGVPVQVLIYDTRGRRVRTLFHGQATAGETRLSWNGTDDQGTEVAQGVYFARLVRPGGMETLRILRLR